MASSVMAMIAFSCFGHHAVMADADMRMSAWHVSTNQTLSTFNLITSASSKLMCVKECMTETQCETCAYDVKSGRCYLQMSTGLVNDTAAVHGVTLFAEACGVSQSPVNYTTNTMTTRWQKTQNGTLGIVECTIPADMLYTGDNPAISCTGSGRWEVKSQGTCKQHVWRNETAVGGTVYFLPAAPTTGWTICVNGIPTTDRMYVNLNRHDDIVVHVDCRMKFGAHTDTLVVTSKVNGSWIESPVIMPVTPFPMTQGQPFRMKLVAVNMTSLQVFIDNELYLTYQSPVALNQVKSIYPIAALNLTELDVWCQK